MDVALSRRTVNADAPWTFLGRASRGVVLRRFATLPRLARGGSSAGRSSIRDTRVPWFLLALVAALLAWVDPSLPWKGGTVARVVLVDGSSSTGRTAFSPDDWAAFTDGLSTVDRVVVVAFGADARRIGAPVTAGDAAPWSEAGRGRLGVDPDGSDVAAALRFAAAEFAALPDHVALREIVLTGDGRVTSDRASLVRAAREVAAAGCTRLILRSSAGRRFTTLVRQVRGPGATFRGAPFQLEVAGVAEGRVQIELLRDDVPEVRRSIVARGPFRVRFDRVEPEAGEVVYAARLAGSDLPGTARAARTRVVVRDPATPLFVGDRPAPWADVPSIGVDAFDVDPASALAVHDVVWIDGPADGRLRGTTLERIGRHVARGGAVVWFGGPSAFHDGGWSGRPLEDLVPLRCRPPDDSGLFLYLALDASGSMARPWSATGDTARSRDAVVRAAAAALIDGAARDTTLVLRRFNDRLLPEGRGVDATRLDAAGRARARSELDAGPRPAGATALVPPLREARELLRSRPEERKLMLVLTDGRVADDQASLDTAVAEVASSGARLVVLTPGAATAGERLTRALARVGLAPRSVPAAEDLPRVFREAEVAARTEGEVLRDVIAGVPSTAAAAFRSLDALPTVAQAARTHVEPDASVVLRAADGAPLAAWARRGLGGVAAVATSPGRDGWWPATGAVRALLDALGAAASAPGRGQTVRAGREADGSVLVRASGEAAPAAVAWEGGSAGLRPAGEGLWICDAGSLPDTASRLEVLDARGARLSAHGLDVPVADEYRIERDLDAADLIDRCTAGERPHRGGARPWLVVLAILLLVGGAIPGRGQVRAPRTR